MNINEASKIIQADIARELGQITQEQWESQQITESQLLKAKQVALSAMREVMNDSYGR